MKSKKRKILKLGIIALMPIFALLLCLHNTYAYYLTSDGDVSSDNLADLNTIQSVVSNSAYNYTINNQTLILQNNNSTSDPYIYFSDFITLKANTTYSIYCISNNTLQYIGLTYPDNTTNFYQTFGSNRSTFTTSNSNIKCGLGIEGLQNLSYEIKIMIYEGNYELNYEPYQLWIASDKYQRQSLYSIFNGASCSLWSFYQDNLDTSTLIAMDTLNLDVDQVNLTLNDMPNIKTEIQTQSSDSWFNTGRYYISVYLNKQQINALLRFSDFSSTYQYIGLTGSDRGLFDKNIYGTNESQSISINTMGNDYGNIRIFNMVGLNENFNLQLSFSSADYNLGYNDGYSSGYNSAMSSGNSNAYIEGYNEGYNDGVEEDLSSSGFRTLITTILSYPVNMVRESLNFEFMGIHIASVVMFVISLGIVAFVIKRFKD